MRVCSEAHCGCHVTVYHRRRLAGWINAMSERHLAVLVLREVGLEAEGMGHRRTWRWCVVLTGSCPSASGRVRAAERSVPVVT